MHLPEQLGGHPNPSFYRDGYYILDGEWDFDFDRTGELVPGAALGRKINVPFVYQSAKSGIMTDELCDTVWYRRTFTLPSVFEGKRAVLHFGAVDYEASVWVNGTYIGNHTGGYSSFSFDITDALKSGDGENTLEVRAFDDSYRKDMPRGKQLWTDGPFGCWYRRYTGIWQTVWLEAVEKLHIAGFVLRPDSDRGMLDICAEVEGLEHGKSCRLAVRVEFRGDYVGEADIEVTGRHTELSLPIVLPRLNMEGLAQWNTVTPNLYSIGFTLADGGRICDSAESYFGIRKLETAEGKMLTAGFPFYLRMILNQGYYPEGFITPEDDERIKSDIMLIKELGYNGMRIHQKIESAKFLYYCDLLGIFVWEEMPSSYEFRKDACGEYLHQLDEIIKRDINHPSIITWVLFNESWGILKIRTDKTQQDFTLSAYYAARTLDDTRFIISNDGWHHTKSDLCTLHDYSASGDTLVHLHNSCDYTVKGSNPPAQQRRRAFADGFSYEGQPYLISEYGGVSFDADNGWGYNSKASSEEDFLLRFESLTAAIKRIPHVKGYCYTQFTDVENEMNGIYTINRTPKIAPEKIKAVNLK